MRDSEAEGLAWECYTHTYDGGSRHSFRRGFKKGVEHARRETDRQYNEPINRSEFLSARMAYLAYLRRDGYSLAEMRDAINIHDDLQALMLLQTWDSK